MKIIKNAIVFKAELPRAELLRDHLAELPFEPVGQAFISRAGFIANPVTGECLNEIEGGVSISVRHDEKILPKGSVTTAVQDAIDVIENDEERELDDDERGLVRERVFMGLVANALIKSTVITAFYSTKHQLLIVPTTNKALAQIVIGLLIKAVGSVKTSTIHVSDIKGGLTARLKRHLDNEPDAFDGFKLGESCLLKHKTNTANFDLDNLDDAKAGLAEALHAEMQVERMELVHGTMSFKLTKDFHLRGIDFFGELTEDELEAREDADRVYLWRLEAAVQMLQVVDAINRLCDLLGYSEPDQPPQTVVESDAIPQTDDEFLEQARDAVIESGRASTSFLQRKLKIGYNRAARLIEELERLGVVTPMKPDGSRQVIL